MTYNEADKKVASLLAYIKVLSKQNEVDYQNAYTVGYLSSILTSLCAKSELVQAEIDFFLEPMKEAA